MNSRPREPALKDETSAFHHLMVNRIILWCTPATRPYHWISSFEFKEPFINEDDGFVYTGVSLNMWQPVEHELTLAVGDKMNYRGCLQIQARRDESLVSRHAEFERHIGFNAIVTVGDLIDLIIRKNLQFYRFTEQCSGCMCWQLSFLHRMVSEGWILASKMDEVEEGIRAKMNQVGEALIPFPPRIGTFYMILTED